MDYHELKQLLARYYDGTASEQDEAYLRRYFASDEVPADPGIERDLFNSFALLKKDSEPDKSLKDDILASIDLGSQPVSEPGFLHGIRWPLSVAAGILILIGIYFMSDRRSPSLPDTYSDPRKAYEVTKHTLLYVSVTMNKGMSKLSPLTGIHEGLKEMDHLKKINGYINQINTKEK
jgi:hypothetical protein